MITPINSTNSNHFFSNLVFTFLFLSTAFLGEKMRQISKSTSEITTKCNTLIVYKNLFHKNASVDTNNCTY